MNIIIQEGNIGSDATVTKVGEYTVCNFSIAGRSGYGENEKTIWFDCAIWGKRAEGSLPTYLTKGKGVVVSGEFGTKEGDNGKTYLTIRVSDVVLKGDMQAGASQGAPAQGGYSPQQQQQGGYGHQQPQQQQGGYAPQQQPMNQQQPSPQQQGFAPQQTQQPQQQQQGYGNPQTPVDDLDIPF